MKKVLSGLGLFMLVVVALFLPAPASAAVTQVWEKHGTGTVTVVNTSGVKLTKASADQFASLEAADLGVVVHEGDTVTVDYALMSGADFAAGAVRLFVYDKANADTMTEAPKAFVAAESTSGTLSIEVGFNGVLGTAGLVYDSSNASVGTVSFSDMKVEGKAVDFTATTGSPDLVEVTPIKPKFVKPTCTDTGEVTPDESQPDKILYVVVGPNAKGVITVTAQAKEGYRLKEGAKAKWTFKVAKLTGAQCEAEQPPAEEPPANEPPAEEPPAGEEPEAPAPGTPSDSSSPTVVPGEVGGAAGGSTGGNLPVTGSRVLFVAGAGGLLVAVGGLLFVWAKRRNEDTETA